jgi:hypothetical protein
METWRKLDWCREISRFHSPKKQKAKAMKKKVRGPGCELLQLSERSQAKMWPVSLCPFNTGFYYIDLEFRYVLLVVYSLL